MSFPTLYTFHLTTLGQVSGRIADIAVGIKCFRGLRLKHPLDTTHDMTQEEVVLRRFRLLSIQDKYTTLTLHISIQ